MQAQALHGDLLRDNATDGALWQPRYDPIFSSISYMDDFLELLCITISALATPGVWRGGSSKSASVSISPVLIEDDLRMLIIRFDTVTVVEHQTKLFTKRTSST